MPNEQDELFASVDALLEHVADQDALPDPAERRRLREAGGLSQDQVARALSVRRETVTSWEVGRTEPRPPKRAAYARLLEGLAARYPADPTTADRPAPTLTEASAPTAPTAPPTVAPALAIPAPAAPEQTPAPAPAAAGGAAPRPADHTEPPSPSRRPTAKNTPPKNALPKKTPPKYASSKNSPPKKPAEAPTGTDPRFAHGPLGVLDEDGSLYCVGGLVLDCPAKTLPALVEWTLSEAKLGAPRLHRSGKDADPLIVLTAAAAGRLGLPAELEDRRGLRLPEDHQVIKQLARAEWKLTRRGFGPWARIYRPTEGGRRQCVQLAVLPWGALDERSWGATGQLPPADVAAVLGSYAQRVITPLGSTAVCGLELMTALRPPTRAVKNASGSWESGPMPGSLTEAVDPAPPEAPMEHPVVAACYPRFHERTPDQVVDEEAYDWFRPLTDEECTAGYTHAVGLDVNMAFAAAANRLVVGLGPATHEKRPDFDPKLPGSWLVDLSHVDLDPRLPSPFTPKGIRPTGPAWYSTSTVAYAVELGARVQPAEAYVRHESGAYLDPWYTRLRDAYLATMADLGVTTGMTDEDFLAAMARHKNVDPGRAAVLSAIKSSVKGGIGKLRERPQSARHKHGERWPALERPTWSPHIRAELIGKARTNMHRKMTRLAAAGLFPVAVLSDCAVYLSRGPSPLDFLPYTPEGKPVPGGFRLGVSPGMVKHEGTQDFLWLASMIEDEQINPARHIKGTDAAADGE
ncbi:telomere-associated protein Tap [Streptomyces auratus]|uniref:Helix-turn-helix transcriptional regulator n=1 Tax=Streptomyces auratus AGR0001 TaxID=1160718 RepID=J2JR60_9ACTN|nr:helix-turn-helix transcriptional regulator [Streptomyces auratus]QTZ95716.1 helix-turn-helix transcriptional regulator [Streptomyces auratus AGR0001]